MRSWHGVGSMPTESQRRRKAWNGTFWRLLEGTDDDRDTFIRVAQAQPAMDAACAPRHADRDAGVLLLGSGNQAGRTGQYVLPQSLAGHALLFVILRSFLLACAGRELGRQ